MYRQFQDAVGVCKSCIEAIYSISDNVCHFVLCTNWTYSSIPVQWNEMYICTCCMQKIYAIVFLTPTSSEAITINNMCIETFYQCLQSAFTMQSSITVHVTRFVIGL